MIKRPKDDLAGLLVRCYGQTSITHQAPEPSLSVSSLVFALALLPAKSQRYASLLAPSRPSTEPSESLSGPLSRSGIPLGCTNYIS